MFAGHPAHMTDADAAAKIEILPLTPGRMADLATLFGLGGDPKRCWCSFFRVRNADIINGTVEENRGVLERSMAAAADENRAPGLVAYRDGVPIRLGQCRAARRLPPSPAFTRSRTP